MSVANDRERQRIRAYREELDENPRSLVFAVLADALNRISEFDQAVSVASSGLSYHPRSIAGLIALAVAHDGLEDVGAALQALKTALVLDPENGKIHASIGRLLVRREMAQRAVPFLKRAYELEPSQTIKELLAAANQSPTGEPPKAGIEALGAILADVESFEAEATVYDARPGALIDPGLQEEKTEFAPISQAFVELRQGWDAVGEVTPANNVKDLEAASSAGPGRPSLRGGGAGALDADHLAPKVVPEAPSKKRPRGAQDRPAAPAAPEPASEPVEGGSVPPGSVVVSRPLLNTGDLADPTDRGLAKPPVALGSLAPVPEAPAIALPGAPYDEVTVPQDGESSSESDDSVPAPEKAVAVADKRRVVIEKRRAPADALRAPAQSSSPPAEAEKVTPKAAKTPAGKSKAPADKSKAPADKSKAPAGKSKAPADKSKAPAGKSKAPAGQSKAPAGKSKAPADKSKAPAGKSKAPAENPAIPLVTNDAAPSQPPEAALPRLETAMVDDVVWGMYGAAGPPKAPADNKRAGARRRSVLIVRSAGFWAKAAMWAAFFLGGLASAWLGYALTRQTAVPQDEVSERVRTVAADIEQGGLASLLRAEESLKELAEIPKLDALVVAATAEVDARIWAYFGHAPERRAAVLERLSRFESAPSLEAWYARVLVAEAGEISAARLFGVELMADSEGSAKQALIAARISDLNGEPQAALETLLLAHGRHPTHRHLTMALARAMAARGQYAAASRLLGSLIERADDDIEVYLLRYVLGGLASKDDELLQIESRLSGLLRDEIPAVAKDEIGRAELVFAVAAFRRGKYKTGLSHVTRADGAYSTSPDYQESLGDLWLALGQWERAKEAYLAAEKVASSRATTTGLARAEYGALADIKRKRGSQSVPGAPGAAKLPFGRVRLAVDRFTYIVFEPDADFFPEEAYSKWDGKARLKALHARTLGLERLDRGEPAEAIEFLEDARIGGQSPAVELALGRAHAALGAHDKAVVSYARALRLEDDAVVTRLRLAESQIRIKRFGDALSTLAPLENGPAIAPEAHRLRATALRHSSKAKAATAEMRKLLEIEPSGRHYLELGRLHHLLDDSTGALSAYESALASDAKLGHESKPKNDPRSALDRYYIGRIRLAKTWSKGTALLKSACGQVGVPPECYFYQGKALLKRRRLRASGKRSLRRFLKSEDAAPEEVAQARRLLRR